jgi:hypothetical protein
MKRKRSEGAAAEGLNGDEAALMEEIRQLRAAIQVYRELVERLLSERQDKPGR